MKFFHKLYEGVSRAVSIALTIGFVVFWFAYILKLIIEPLAPLITFTLVALGTVESMQRRITAILSIGGIALYIASWPAVALWGAAGMLVWTLGVMSWFIGVFRPFPCLQRAHS